MDKHYQGLTVYYFRKSGQTGKVAPLGTAKVSKDGVATRLFKTAPGGIIAAYGHLIGAKDDANNGYSNTVSFKVK